MSSLDLSCVLPNSPVIEASKDDDIGGFHEPGLISDDEIAFVDSENLGCRSLIDKLDPSLDGVPLPLQVDNQLVLDSGELKQSNNLFLLGSHIPMYGNEYGLFVRILIRLLA